MVQGTRYKVWGIRPKVERWKKGVGFRCSAHGVRGNRRVYGLRYRSGRQKGSILYVVPYTLDLTPYTVNLIALIFLQPPTL